MEKHYTNGEVTVIWRPEVCTHSTICWRSLPTVFNPRVRPWVNAQGADTNTIIAQVDLCPSGALSWYMNLPEEEKQTQEVTNETYIAVDGPGSHVQQAEISSERIEIQAIPNGPLIVKGDAILRLSSGEIVEVKGKAALCRCGESKNKPFCDGSHGPYGFKG
jgi:uncharacterized Fe-S cluster protein YjdI